MKDSPGPQSYDLKDGFSKEGKYIQSQHRGEGTRAFTQTMRIGFTETFAKNHFGN